MVRKRSLAVLEPWLDQAQSSLLASFANGVLKDMAAVAADITSPWSNDQTEGQITGKLDTWAPVAARARARRLP